MTLDKLLETFELDQVQREQFKIWLQMELSKLVLETDVRHLVFTSFDNSIAEAIKHCVVRNLYKEWQI